MFVLKAPEVSDIAMSYTSRSNDLGPGAHGGALVNLIHSYTSTGDPFVRHFTDALLEDVSAPFFASLHRWLFSGELYDPFEEFFVAVDPKLAHLRLDHHPSAISGAGGLGNLSIDGGFGGRGGEVDIAGDKDGALSLWQNKYQFRPDMLPAFVSEAFGKKVCFPHMVGRDMTKCMRRSFQPARV